MSHFKSEFYKNVIMYSKILWKHVYEVVREHANSDHH